MKPLGMVCGGHVLGIEELIDSACFVVLSRDVLDRSDSTLMGRPSAAISGALKTDGLTGILTGIPLRSGCMPLRWEAR